MKRLVLMLMALLMLVGCTNNAGEDPVGDKMYEIAGKTYYNVVDNYDNVNHSNVWFGMDSSFVLTDNFYDGTYQITGHWSIKMNVLTLEVETTGVGNFDKVIFEITDDDNLVLKNNLAGSQNGDQFTTDKSKLQSTTIGIGGDDVSQNGYRRFINAHQENANGNSFIDFFDDGTFSFTEIEGMGAVEIKGLWSKMGDVYALSNFESAVNDYQGNPLYNIEFEIVDDNAIILKTDVQSSFATQMFTTDGKLPAWFLEYYGTEGPIEPDMKDETWKHEAIPDVLDEYTPYLTLNADGSFTFIENCYAGMFYYSGWYTRDWLGIYCDVTDLNLQGFAGDDVTSFSFEFTGENKMVLNTDLCMSRAGDVFYLQ